MQVGGITWKTGSLAHSANLDVEVLHDDFQGAWGRSTRGGVSPHTAHRATFEHVGDIRDAEKAPAPDGGAWVHAYAPDEVVRINLRVNGAPYRAVARHHHDVGGRRAYDLFLWPRSERAPHGWYWFDETRMTRRDYRRSTS